MKKFALIQEQVDLARVACALERYRLAHGEYPETLDALSPQFIEKLPHDIINGQPLHYRRTDNGKFVLYSVGWNEKDDGGVVVIRKGGSSVDPEQGDWVWKYSFQKHPTLNIQHPPSKVSPRRRVHSVLNVECWLLNVFPFNHTASCRPAFTPCQGIERSNDVTSLPLSRERCGKSPRNLAGTMSRHS